MQKVQKIITGITMALILVLVYVNIAHIQNNLKEEKRPLLKKSTDKGMTAMLDDIEISAAQACISIFETGHVAGPDMYSTVSYNARDTGGLSYGRAQATLNSGSLYNLVDKFCQDTLNSKQPVYGIASSLEVYMSRLRNRDATLNTDQTFIGLLRDAGKTVEMQECQDDFFNQVFWNPSQAVFRSYDFFYTLSAAVIYDSFVQGGWTICRNAVIQKYGAPASMEETTWISYYCAERADWFHNSSNPLLRACVYRPASFTSLIGQSAWDLTPPFTVHGVTVTKDLLLGHASPPAPITPVHGSLHNNKPLLATDIQPVVSSTPSYVTAVKQVQTALNAFGFTLKVDGIYGPNTAAAVGKFQKAHMLNADQEVGPITYQTLGIEP